MEQRRVTETLTEGGEVDITNRSRIEWRVTTCPANMGYDGTPTNWKASAPDIRTTAKQILQKVSDHKSRMGLNGGIFYREEYTRKGVRVELEELQQLEFDAMYAEYNRDR